jgi:hypothetical protein
MTYAAGQIVELVNEPVSVKTVIYDMILEYAEAMDRLSQVNED